jgi:acyl dehydratase
MNFDDFVIGAHLGGMELELSSSLIEEWRRLFPQAPAQAGETRIPSGYISVITMRAYMRALRDRPPGNIHGEQSYEVRRLPEIGATVVTDVSCIGKEIRRERRWVTFGTRTRNSDGVPMFRGEMKIAWSR